MKNYKILLLLIVIFSFLGCERKIDLNAHKIHWDRDMCKRCKMVVSERNHAVQAINPSDGKVYYFDDIGCLVLWFKESNIEWAENAVLWVTDLKTAEWINAKEAKWSTISVTPMGFGFGAYKSGSEPKDAEIISFKEVSKRAILLEERKKKALR